MKVPVAPTDAEKKLQAELDSSRLEYLDRIAEVQATYFAQLELLHNKLARTQSAAIERYHQNARAQLSEIIDGLGSVIADEKTIDAPTSKIVPVYGTQTEGERRQEFLKQPSTFFAPEPDYIPELDIVADPALLSQTDRAWFSRRRPRHGA